MSYASINVGGKKFEATLATWSKSPTLDKLIRKYSSPFVNRSPEVFDHILDWLREGKLYIDCPSNSTYKRLCADADFYGLEDLSRFLANRINLCSRVYFKTTACAVGILCNLDGFRALKPADGLIDRLLAGDPAALAQITFVDADTVLLDIDLTQCRNVLSRPHMRWTQCYYHCCPEPWKTFFGSRFAESASDYYDYNPVLRAEPKA